MTERLAVPTITCLQHHERAAGCAVVFWYLYPSDMCSPAPIIARHCSLVIQLAPYFASGRVISFIYDNARIPN